MSAVLNSNEVVTQGDSKSGTIEISEGDWKSYQQHIKKCHDTKNISDFDGSVIDYKRACAMAYLGRRAQFHGGICSINHPHIMTTQFILNLEANNKAQRYRRYPWLEALIHLLAEIERIQDEISSGNNVISLMSSSK